MHYKQKKIKSQVYKNTRPSHEYLYKATHNDIFIKMKDMLEVIKKSNQSKDIEN